MLRRQMASYVSVQMLHGNAGFLSQMQCLCRLLATCRASNTTGEARAATLTPPSASQCVCTAIILLPSHGGSLLLLVQHYCSPPPGLCILLHLVTEPWL